MAKKKEDKKLTKDQAEKKILTLKKDLFNIRFKKVNNQVNNPAQYNEIKKSIARLYTNLKRSKKYHAHDETNKFKEGEKVSIIESKPYSKKKTWQVVE